MGTEGAAALGDFHVIGAVAPAHVATHAEPGVTAIGDGGKTIHEGDRPDLAQLMWIGRIMRVVTSRATDGFVGSIGGGRTCHSAGETSRGVATDTAFATGAAGIPRRDRVPGIGPLWDFDVVGFRIVALGAIGNVKTDRDGIGIAQFAVGVQMLTSGAMAIFALNISDILKGFRHSGPIAVGEHCRERPAQLRRDVVKAAVAGIGIDVVSNGVARDAILAVRTDQAINASGKLAGMERVGPGGHIRGEQAAAMAGDTSFIPTQVGSGGNILADVGGSV